MCGFIGEVNLETPQQSKVFDANLKLKNRGPDSQKIGYINENLEFNISENFSVDSKINLGFSRLSILELSKLADQPFISKDKKFALLFNGEIYNFKEIQKDLKLKGVNFQSEKSDTEVVLNSLIIWGDDAIQKFKGQFSIVFIDLVKNEITLIRDRLGQKPLFFYTDEKKLFFDPPQVSPWEDMDPPGPPWVGSKKRSPQFNLLVWKRGSPAPQPQRPQEMVK